ncbi:MAG: lipocalin-like domain-containing protein, partial [Candidatus Eremiobacterota bacterium]
YALRITHHDSHIKLLTLIISVFILLFQTSCTPGKGSAQFNTSISISDVLKDHSTEGFELALKPRIFSFPSDHGPHETFKTEWWYFTGNLNTKEGRHFGYELTFFRTALSANSLRRTSLWSSKNIYMAHFAVSDVKNKSFYAFDRFSRDGLSLAGAQSKPFKVWLEDWIVSGEPVFPMVLSASENNISINITMSGGKPVVLQGNKGLSQKGPSTGNASYYYSCTRLNTEGTIKINNNNFHIHGLSWMDREWSTSSLEKNQVGWDWFAIQLSDGREVMYYQMRKKDGTIEALSNGTLINKDGTGKYLSRNNVKLEVIDYWKSSDSKAIYPSEWYLTIPEERMKLHIIPYMPDQELNLTVRYWEGAVKIKGTCKEKNISGNGYVELTGYNQ